MAGEERLGDGVEGDAVLGPYEAVALVRKYDVGHWDALRGHGRDDLVALGNLATHVIGTVADQHGLGDVAGPVQRRAGLEQGPAVRRARIADAATLLLVERGPVGRRVGEHRLEVGDSDHRYA